MVQIDWKKFMGIKPEKLTEQEKDDIYDTVTWYVPDVDINKKNLIHFVRVTQEVLKFKAEQVESLTNELDDIAAKQGQEEGSKLYQYLDEIEQLREELEYYKKLEKNSSKSVYSSSEDIKREIVKLELQNEELLTELKEKEKELFNEKEEVEKYAGQVAALQREKQELTQELKTLQDETIEKSGRSLRDSPELGAEKFEELAETIRQKNKHISQLLEDIEVVEEENLSLRAKLTSVRDELKDTTTHMTEITAELAKLRHVNEIYESQNADSGDKIKSLMGQVEELVEEKNKHDKHLDEYIAMFNTKLQEWKDLLEAKDEEITELKAEIEKLSSSPAMFVGPDVDDRKLNSRLMQQEKEIRILKEELEKATEEINNSAELIEKLKEKHLKLVGAPQQNESMIAFYEEKIKVLEEKLTYAEEDAIIKAEEMTDLVVQLREYESGVFGLAEAVSRMKKLEKHIQEKDMQIEKLVEICNNLEIKLDSFEEQNMTLRERLGLSLSDEIDTSGIKLRYRKDEELLENIKLQLDRKEEELVKIKLKYRKVVKFLKSYPPLDARSHSEEPKSSNREVEETQKKLEAIIKENDALRKGMHEILESIREQDCSGTVEVQSACLERLLEALDSRHVSGWYHPAMRLQAQLSTEEGKNEELRNQIRLLKTEEKKRASELQNAYLKIQSLEYDLSTPRYEEERIVEAKISDRETSEELDKEPGTMKKLSTEQEQRIIELESELMELKVAQERVKSEMEQLERMSAAEKENLVVKVTELEVQVAAFRSQKMDRESLKIPEMSSQIAVLERKNAFLKNLESDVRESNEKLKKEMIEGEEKMLCEILKLQNEKSNLLNKVQFLEKELLSAVPREKYCALKKELLGVTAKYQNTVSLALEKEVDTSSGKFQVDVDLLQKEKSEILDELRVVKEKLIVAEGLISEEAVTKGDFNQEISILASKLAATEVRELNEKQKSAHLEKLNEIFKSQQEEVEARNGDLLKQVTTLTKDIEKFQEVERDLRAKIIERNSEEEQSVLLEKIESLNSKCKDLVVEKDNLQELFEISQGQCRALQEWKDADKLLVASLNEQILVLQSSSDDKAAISRLSHELTMTKLQTSQLNKKNNDLKMKVSKLLAHNVELEIKIGENILNNLNEKKKHLALTGYLYEAMDEVRKLYGAAVRFRDVEDIYRSKAEIKVKENDLMNKTKEMKVQIHEYATKKEEIETQLENLEDLKKAFKGDIKNLIFWHNKNTELRLKEAKSRRENEFLVGEITQLENGLKKLNEEIAALEEENIEKEKEWEQKQILWEKAQLQMCQLLQEKGTKKSLRDAKTNTELIESDVVIPQDRKILKSLEWKIQELEEDVIKLRKEGMEKDEIIAMKEKLVNSLSSKPQVVEIEETVTKDKVDNAEKEALKVTVQSLQDIIKQKEDTILRYQNLLKESREEFSKASAKFQEELKALSDTMTAQTKAYTKLKNSVQPSSSTNENIPSVVEKYVTKIHELEEELGECQMNLAAVNNRFYTNQQEVDKWRNLAEERLLMVEDTRQRLEAEYKNEIEQYKDEIRRHLREIDRLNQYVETIRNESTRDFSSEGKLMQTIQQLQMKLLDQESDRIPVKSDQLSDCTFDKPQRQRSGQALREVETLKRQLKFARDESTRLREQIRLLQVRTQKRPRTTGSSTTRSDSRSSLQEESLTSKIKHLEELLTVSKERERELMEINQKKLKSAEEVARWDERKKSQRTVQQLTGKIREKEAEVEVLKNKNESFRNMVYKCERDKSVLESQLKSAKGGSGGVNAKIEKLIMEKSELQAEVEVLKSKIEEQMRHSSGLGAALLQEKLEEQERKLAAFELASKGHSAMIDELERIKTLNSNLEKLNLKLESENLALQLRLEKEKAENKFLLDKVKHCQESNEEIKRKEGDKKFAHLQKTVERLTEENKKLRCGFKDTRGYGTIEKVRVELAKMKEEQKLLRSKYVQAVDKNIALEKELKSCHYQIQLMEEKDLVEVLRTNQFQSASDLTQELMEVKAKLAHKTQLLNRVKTLLVKAAAKEKALHQEICFLQNMVPKA